MTQTRDSELEVGPKHIPTTLAAGQTLNREQFECEVETRATGHNERVQCKRKYGH